MADEIIYPVNGKRVWWGAIFAGGIVTLLVSFMLGLLGIAIGAANVDFRNGISTSGVGQSALIWWLVITFVAYFCGGCVAGRLANVFRRGDAKTAARHSHLGRCYDRGRCPCWFGIRWCSFGHDELPCGRSAGAGVANDSARTLR